MDGQRVGVTSAEQVLRVLEALGAAGCSVWVAGGWGVDALVGMQTRPHRDLDLAVDAQDMPAALAALGELGYTVETDWLPVRAELAAPGSGWVDIHPVTFNPSGEGRQPAADGPDFIYPVGCLVHGSIAGQQVGCLSIAQQLTFHSGYPPRDIDLADLALLRNMASRNDR